MIQQPAAFFLDANIPMYAVGREHRYRQPCLDLMRAIAEQRIVCFSSSEVLQEILHRYFSLGERNRGIGIVRRVLTVMPEGILDVGRVDIVEAMDLAVRESGRAARDYVHWATMRLHGISDMISADSDFDGLPGITRHDPLALAARLAP